MKKILFVVTTVLLSVCANAQNAVGNTKNEIISFYL